MRFFNLGPATWQESTALVYALAALQREGIVLSRLQPSTLCVGNLVNSDRVVNADYCRACGIEVVSSQTRTNSLCLAKSQLELRLLVPQYHLPLNEDQDQPFRLILSPLLQTCLESGIQAQYRAPNEITVRGRRLAVACKGEMNRCVVVSASLAVEFDAGSFGDALQAPDESLRARLVELVSARRTCLNEELEISEMDGRFEQRLCSSLSDTFGPLEPGIIDDEMWTQIRKYELNGASTRQTRRNNGGANDWNVDVGAGTELQQRSCRAPGGLLRANSEWQDKHIAKTMLSGDFLCYPPGCLQRLEDSLVCASLGQVAAKVCDFYRDAGWITPGILPGHWARVLLPLSLEDYKPVASAAGN